MSVSCSNKHLLSPIFVLKPSAESQRHLSINNLIFSVIVKHKTFMFVPSSCANQIADLITHCHVWSSKCSKSFLYLSLCLKSFINSVTFVDTQSKGACIRYGIISLSNVSRKSLPYNLQCMQAFIDDVF